MDIFLFPLAHRCKSAPIDSTNPPVLSPAVLVDSNQNSEADREVAAPPSCSPPVAVSEEVKIPPPPSLPSAWSAPCSTTPAGAGHLTTPPPPTPPPLLQNPQHYPSPRRAPHFRPRCFPHPPPSPCSTPPDTRNRRRHHRQSAGKLWLSLSRASPPNPNFYTHTLSLLQFDYFPFFFLIFGVSGLQEKRKEKLQRWYRLRNLARAAAMLGKTLSPPLPTISPVIY